MSPAAEERRSLDPAAFDALTFDCYGTLIDWERGIVDAFRGAVSGLAWDDEELLARYARVESRLQGGAYKPYREILVDVAVTLAGEAGLPLDPALAGRFAASVSDWPPFEDTRPALEALGRRYKLAVVSNVDDDLFAGSAARLGVPFDAVVTAQPVRSYKPRVAHFHEALRRLALPRERVLHVAQSLYHDIRPASELGFTTVWVNRRAGRAGTGATAPAVATPTVEVPDLSALAALLQA